MKARFAALGLVAALAVPAGADTLKANYALSIVGIPIGHAFAKAELDANAYKVDLAVQLSGVAAMVVKTKGAASGAGVLSGASVLPTSYANTTANPNETRTVRMSEGGGTINAVDISPPFYDMAERVPVSAAHKSRVVDPVGALVMTVPAGQPLVGAPACNRTIPVFDGLVRFDVALTFVGTRNVRAKGYAGPVSVCAARYTPLAGYKKDSQSTRYMAENRNMQVWLAPIEAAHAVTPYYISVGTKAGTIVIQATEFSVEGKRAAQ
ncbi:MAG: DUF3108 domain-containing protein [Hyphomicrobiales bacterium]|nr:DUF3108 domain-containing protein [Hyphomicrobiales bacterium]